MQQYEREFYLAKPSDRYADKILSLRSGSQGSDIIENVTAAILSLALVGFLIMLIGVIFKPNVIVVSVSISLGLAAVSALCVMIRCSLKAKFSRLVSTGQITHIHHDLYDRWISALDAADIPEAFAHANLTDHDAEILKTLSAQYEAHLINREYDECSVQPSLDAITARLCQELRLAHQASSKQLGLRHLAPSSAQMTS